MNYGLNRKLIPDKKPSTTNNVEGNIFSNFSEDTDLFLRYQEMIYLFSMKKYSEGLVISTNKNRAYIRAKSFNFLSVAQQNDLLESCIKKFPTFASYIHIEDFESEIFMVIEPLISGKIDKIEAQNLTDFVNEYLDIVDYENI